MRYTTALSPALAAGALKSLQKIQNNKEWGINLLIASKKWKKEILHNLSYPVKGESQILSIIVGKEEKAILLQKHLEKRGSLENKKDTVHSMINLIRKYQDLYIHVPHNIQEREEE